jgi:hypothetical protein
MTHLLFSLLPLSLVLLLGAIRPWHSADAFITSPYHRRDARILNRSPLLQAIKLVEKEATDILDLVITQPPLPGAVAALSAATTTDRDQSGDDAVALLVAQQQQHLEEETTKNSNALDGLLWRAVVVVLCAVWASNFPAIKLIVAEPGAFC